METTQMPRSRKQTMCALEMYEDLQNELIKITHKNLEEF